MGERLFDSIVIVDWSSAASPTTGADSIWWAEVETSQAGGKGGLTGLKNPATRAEAREQIADLLAAAHDAGRRTLVGFDFPFGYPSGTAHALTGTPGWQALWSLISDRLEDDEKNANNRFDLADELAARGAPFWGHPQRRNYATLTPRKPADFGAFPEYRRAEIYAQTRKAQPKSVWQLAYTGGVGAQVLTGLPVLQALREDPRFDAQIWPFETGLRTPEAQTVIAEVYPSLVSLEGETHEIKDARQVIATARALARLDQNGALGDLFAGPADLTSDDRKAIETEEAFILGLGFEEGLNGLVPAYLKDPKAIYAESFATVAREANLARHPKPLHPVITRLIHSCGMTEIADTLIASPDLADRAGAALTSGAAVLCDCEMVASGIIRRGLPADNAVICTLNDPTTPARAKDLQTTRSAAATELWAAHLQDAIIVIGNAPTALFHLLEMLQRGGPRPAAILGFPVGFVGAAESKEALANGTHGIPFITLPGRRGGSAMASAALNGLCLGLAGDGT